MKPNRMALLLNVEDLACSQAFYASLGKVTHVGQQHYGLDEVWIRDPDGYHVVLASEVESA